MAKAAPAAYMLDPPWDWETADRDRQESFMLQVAEAMLGRVLPPGATVRLREPGDDLEVFLVLKLPCRMHIDKARAAVTCDDLQGAGDETANLGTPRTPSPA